MMAIGIDKVATPAHAFEQRKRKSEATLKEHPEQKD